MSEIIERRLGIEDKYIYDENTRLLDKRTFFISNRVVGSQSSLLLLTSLLTSLIIITGLSSFITSLWYVFLLILPITVIIITYIKRETFYFHHHWILAFFPLSIVWLSFTTFIGVFVDNYCGYGKTLWVDLFLILIYIISFIIAKTIRKNRFSFKKESLQHSFMIFSIMLIVGTLIVGYLILDYGLRTNKIKSFYKEDYGQFSRCYICILGIFVMISGLGIIIASLLNYYMLYLLFKNTSWNVEIAPPNRLYFSCLSRTMIWMALFWFFLELLIPPIVGKKGGRGRSGHGAHRGTRGSNQNQAIVDANRKKLIDQEWQKQDLDEKTYRTDI